MNIGDKVLIKRGGGRGLTWKILKIEGDRAQVDLVRGSLLGPQWEDLASLEPVRSLPDPNITGPCQVQASILCKPSEGRQRMDPMDMAAPETSFRAYVMCCQPCYDAQADEYIRVTHGRA
jgi:hypothetical protein